MRFDEIHNEEQLWSFMTDPSEELMRSLEQVKGDILVLGGSGKMGKELVGLIRNADRLNGHSRKITVASTFSDPTDELIFEKLDVHCMKGDLSDEAFIDRLPDEPFIFYMMGFKFGSSSDWRRAFHLNAIVPYLTGRKFTGSGIMVFSSGNPYPHTDRYGNGCTESSLLDPNGIYGWSIVARESAFSTTAMQHPEQKICFFRLMYAQHLYYGVLIDLARMIYNHVPVSQKMPAVNLISQRDANETAIRALKICNNTPEKLNVAGPALQVRDIAAYLGDRMKVEPILLDDAENTALLANDSKCSGIFGPYRDDPAHMMNAAADWITGKGRTWDKPTFFGKADHSY